MPDFPIPPSVVQKIVPEKKQPQQAPKEEPKTTPVDVELPVTEEDKTKFFDSIMKDSYYTETIDIFDGKMSITLRTRLLSEGEQILELVKTLDPKSSVVDLELAMGTYNLAFALVSINNTKFDSGSFEERVARIRSLPLPKYTALLEVMRRFDKKVHAMEKAALSPNFWTPESDTSL